MKAVLSTLPQVESVLQDPRIQRWFTFLGRRIVVDAVRTALNTLREQLRDRGEPYSREEVILACLDQIEVIKLTRLQAVVNCTGVIIHTNLGRSPISEEVWDRVKGLNCSYTNLEFNLSTGKRGSRSPAAVDLLCTLTGAQSALIVNNNAAAIFLILSALAKRKEVVISRSELVQIGGGFRIPDILSASGAKLVEVGTTNVTTVDDYLNAITERTALVLKVHRSNFALRGFTEEPTTSELSSALPSHLPLIVDQGSGVLTSEISGEVSVGSHLGGGASLVCFSADKALGSAQGGCIVGDAQLIATLAKHPLYRVLRVGKTVSSILEATLADHLNKEGVFTLALLRRSVAELDALGRAILDGIESDRVSLVDDTMTLGGGSTPDESLPSRSIEVKTHRPHKDALTLRQRQIPIIPTLTKGALRLNLATLLDDQVEIVRTALLDLLGAP